MILSHGFGARMWFETLLVLPNPLSSREIAPQVTIRGLESLCWLELASDAHIGGVECRKWAPRFQVWELHLGKLQEKLRFLGVQDTEPSQVLLVGHHQEPFMCVMSLTCSNVPFPPLPSGPQKGVGPHPNQSHKVPKRRRKEGLDLPLPQKPWWWWKPTFPYCSCPLPPRG